MESLLPSFKSLAKEVVQVLFLALAFYLALTFTIQSVHVVGYSMYPTLNQDDYLMVSKIDYRLHPPHRGDIVTLKDPSHSGKDFIKRVIALPGESVMIDRDTVYINGKPLLEPYIQNWKNTGEWQVGSPQLVPKNSYFVLGDNRDHSADSRYFGFVDVSQLDGHAFIRLYPNFGLFVVSPESNLP